MVKPRNLGALLALGALTALPACSMFGGGDSSSSRYSQSSNTPPASYAPAGSTVTGASTNTANEQAMPTSRGMIRKVQTALKQNGDYNARVDGVWGPMTERGVRKWQQAHNLTANGVIDVATLQSMNISTGSQNGEVDNGQNAGNSANAGNGANGGMNDQASGSNGGQNYNTAGSNQNSTAASQQPNTPYPTNQGGSTDGNGNTVPTGNNPNGSNGR